MSSSRRRGPEPNPVLAAGAPLPPRVYRTNTMTLDLIPMNVGIYSSIATPGSVRSSYIFNAEDETYHPVGMKPYDKVTGKTITDDSLIVKGVETEKGIVEVTDEDLETGTTKVCKILGFISTRTMSLEELRLICPAKFYQVRAARIKVGRDYRPDAAAQHAYLLVLDAMKTDELEAIVQVTMNDEDPPKMGLLDPGGQLRILAFQNYIRAELPLGELNATEAERKMMQQLVRSKIVAQMPANPDGSREHLDKVLAKKEATGPVTQPSESSSAGVEAPTVDLMKAIEQSLKASKTK